MRFAVIIMIRISYALKKEQEGGHEPKKVEKHRIRRYGPPVNATLSKWPPSHI